jgi:polyhydroxyalkanoate synthesis regulator phasin
MESSPQNKRSAAEVFHQVWSQALVTVSGAEDEVSRLVARLQGLAGWSQEEALRQVREFSTQLTQQRHEMEKQVEDTVRQTLTRVRVPRREELAQLSSRLESLSRRVEALTR